MKKFLLFVLISSLMISFSVSTTSCRRRIEKPDSTKTTTDRKVGYLFYTAFIDEFNPQLFEAFSRFKAAGVTDLIVDLRYNHGGDVGAAGYLASLIAPKKNVQSKSVFTQLEFNTFLNNIYGDQRKYFLGEYSTGQSDPLNANLDIKTVYIIATSDSYSAAELLTFCLKPYMNVVHVGEGTGGKFTASQTIHAFDRFPTATGRPRANILYADSTKLPQTAKDSLRNWGMQPIVAIYSDSRGKDFSAAGQLIPDVAITSRENDRTAYKPLADPTDYLIAPILAKITAANPSAFQNIPTAPRNLSTMIPANLYVAKDAMLRESVRWTPPISASAFQTTSAMGINVVSQFAYDGLAVYYKWSDYITPAKRPTINDNDPEKYFYSLLYPLDTQHGWSWITNDVTELLADFSGTPVDFGWGLTLLWADASKTRIIGIVKYVYPNTPAANAGLKRGDVLTQINGTNIIDVAGSAGDYRKLFGGNMINVAVESTSGNKTVSVAPVRISTNPVLKDTVYTIKK